MAEKLFRWNGTQWVPVTEVTRIEVKGNLEAGEWLALWIESSFITDPSLLTSAMIVLSIATEFIDNYPIIFRDVDYPL